LSALYERDGRGTELRRLFGERLAESALRPGERAALALRLARLQIDGNQARLAVETLVDARVHGGDPALDELLFSALAATGNTSGQVQLCAERARAAEPSERTRWLRRWLAALDASRQGPAERLAVLDRMLVDHGGNAELLTLRLPLVREVGSPERVAEALEQLLACPDASSPAGRRLLVRELLGLLEGPLADPARALALCEREFPMDPPLRMRGLRAARAMGDEARELVVRAEERPRGERDLLRVEVGRERHL
jgi:hypothetical protein